MQITLSLHNIFNYLYTVELLFIGVLNQIIDYFMQNCIHMSEFY